MQLADGREGDFFQQLGERHQGEMEKTEGFADGLDNFAGVAFHVGIEKRFAGDGQGESSHLLMNINDLPVAPALAQTRGKRHHGLGITGDALAMKHRLHQAALTQVEIALTGEQALAQQQTRALQRASFGKLAGAGDQQVFDVIGMIEQEEALAAAAEINDIAVALRQLSHILERIAAQREKSDAEKIGARPRRKLRCVGHGSRSLNGIALFP